MKSERLLYTCDRCGHQETVEVPVAGTTPAQWDVVWGAGLSPAKDLCERCSGSFREFMDGVATVTEAAATNEGRQAAVQLFGMKSVPDPRSEEVFRTGLALDTLGVESIGPLEDGTLPTYCLAQSQHGYHVCVERAGHRGVHRSKTGWTWQ